VVLRYGNDLALRMKGQVNRSGAETDGASLSWKALARSASREQRSEHRPVPEEYRQILIILNIDQN
jgi:hypothetical protein